MASWFQDPLPEVFGRYRIIKVLGQGGMGAVYLARDTQLDREVALKVPHFDAERGPKLLDRFEQEARAAARVHHPNICPIYDVGEIDGKRYFTMAFIDGVGLNQLLRQGKHITPRQAANLIRKLASAVQEAHQCGVIHRDLKPSNILIDRRGEPIIMDFGLARRYRSDDAHLTRVGATIGTPAYMAPEQCRGAREALGPVSDVYSLGVILYELLAGRPPFYGEDSLAILSKVLVDEPPPLSARRPDIDVELERICLKAMAKKPEDRYPSAGVLAAELKTYLKNQVGVNTAVSALVPTLLPDPEPDREAEAVSARATKAGAPPPGPRADRIERADRLSAPPTSDLSIPNLRRSWRLPACGLLALVLGVGALLVIVPVVGYVIYRVTDNGICTVELSDPNADVTVRVDGADVDLHVAGGLRLPSGAHKLEVSGKDYDLVEIPFTIRRGDNPPIAVPLVLKLATVRVMLSDPRAAVEIRINGQPCRPDQVLPVAPRQEHEIVVTGQDYQLVRQRFTAEPGEMRTQVVPLVFKLVAVTVMLSDPKAAVEIKIDGKPGFRHGQVVQLAPQQKHKLEVTGIGYVTLRENFTVKPGKATTMTVHLKKQKGDARAAPGAVNICAAPISADFGVGGHAVRWHGPRQLPQETASGHCSVGAQDWAVLRRAIRSSNS